MAKSTTIEKLVIGFMSTGLTDDNDNRAWLAYCQAEAGAFAPNQDELKGIKVSGKADKGKITFKGADNKAEDVRLNRALVALHLATCARDLSESTGFDGIRADVSGLCLMWKSAREEKAKASAPKPEPAKQNA